MPLGATTSPALPALCFGRWRKKSKGETGEELTVSDSGCSVRRVGHLNKVIRDSLERYPYHNVFNEKSFAVQWSDGLVSEFSVGRSGKVLLETATWDAGTSAVACQWVKLNTPDVDSSAELPMLCLGKWRKKSKGEASHAYVGETEELVVAESGCTVGRVSDHDEVIRDSLLRYPYSEVFSNESFSLQWSDGMLSYFTLDKSGEALLETMALRRGWEKRAIRWVKLNKPSLRDAPLVLRNDKQFVLRACQEDGAALEFASEALRADKEVVMEAVLSNPESLKFALGELNQDKDCLIKANLWDEHYVERNSVVTPTLKKIVLSTRFSLAANSSAHATQFTVALKANPYIASGDFVVYSPNAFNKGTCDPEWTNITWPCRGSKTCQKPFVDKNGVPRSGECCWRYSFRYQLEEAYRTGGFMLQVVDLPTVIVQSQDGWGNHSLGDGQAIESEMARDVGIKTFHFFEPEPEPGLHSYAQAVDQLVAEIKLWYESKAETRAKIAQLTPWWGTC